MTLAGGGVGGLTSAPGLTLRSDEGDDLGEGDAASSESPRQSLSHRSGVMSAPPPLDPPPSGVSPPPCSCRCA